MMNRVQKAAAVAAVVKDVSQDAITDDEATVTAESLLRALPWFERKLVVELHLQTAGLEWPTQAEVDDCVTAAVMVLRLMRRERWSD